MIIKSVSEVSADRLSINMNKLLSRTDWKLRGATSAADLEVIE